jgi:hypothetical protein
MPEELPFSCVEFCSKLTLTSKTVCSYGIPQENGYQLLFLSARSISQAHLTRQFLFNLKQVLRTVVH